MYKFVAGINGNQTPCSLEIQVLYGEARSALFLYPSGHEHCRSDPLVATADSVVESAM